VDEVNALILESVNAWKNYRGFNTPGFYPFIAHKFSTGWAVKSVKKKKSVAAQFAVKYKSETYCWTQKLNREEYGVGQYWVLLAFVKE